MIAGSDVFLSPGMPGTLSQITKAIKKAGLEGFSTFGSRRWNLSLSGGCNISNFFVNPQVVHDRRLKPATRNIPVSG